MKTVEELNEQYSSLVKRFLPEHTSLSESVAEEIERFLAENEQFGAEISNLRLKIEGDIFSETLYDVARLESGAKCQEDDIYLYLPKNVGANIYFGFDYRKQRG